MPGTIDEEKALRKCILHRGYRKEKGIKIMATVKLADVEGMVENQAMPKAERLALELLEVFEADRPLDQEEFEEWIQVSALSVDEVKEATREAMHRGWIEDTIDGLLLTAKGKKKKPE